MNPTGDRLPTRLPTSWDLLVRSWTPEDAEPLGEAIAESVESLRPWLPWIANEPLTVTARRALIEQWQRDWAEGGSVLLGAFVDGVVVGATGMHRRSGAGMIEFGYWVRSSMQGRGLATQIAWIVTDAALALDGIEQVEIHHDRANLASEAVPRKLGYTLTAEVTRPLSAPGEIGTEFQWHMQAETWRSGHADATHERLSSSRA